MVIVKTAPKLRFKDFTDNWKKQKLGKIAKRVSVGIATSSSKYFSSKPNAVPFIKNQDIKDGTIDLLHLEHITPDFDRANRNKRVHPGDILTIRTGYPGKSAVVPNKLDNAQTFTTLITTLKEENPSFVCNYINSNFGKKQIIAVQAGGAQVNVNANRLKEIIIGLPSLKEQNQIDNLLTAINHIISLQKRKLDNLIKIRKFYLSKFFPTKRKAEPELRLKKFTNISWKNKKLGEIGKVKSGIGFPTSEQGGKVGVPFYKVSDMNNKGNEFEMVTANNYVSIDRIKANRWKVIREVPAIFFAKVGAAVLLNRKRLCRIPFLLDNNTMAYCMDQAILDPIFTKMLFETINLPSLAQLGALPSYNASDVESLFVYIPTLEEQKKLAKIFQKIDNLIVYQQKKISLLKQNKEFLLQNLFI